MPVRLFVGNLPYDATEDEIRAHFAPAGSLASVFIPVDRETGRKRGFAFVEFNEMAHAQEAIRQFNNQPFKGRTLAVNEARAKESRPPIASGTGFRPGPRPPIPTGVRPPMSGGMRPSGPPMHRGPAPDFMIDPAADQRAERANRKFGPDAKPARSRAKSFKTEGSKKAFKEKLGGQIFSPDTEDDPPEESEIDDFSKGLEGTDE
jgi:RNA recognition motif-containing protein